MFGTKISKRQRSNRAALTALILVAAVASAPSVATAFRGDGNAALALAAAQSAGEPVTAITTAPPAGDNAGTAATEETSAPTT
jgi:hypothetical protein